MKNFSLLVSFLLVQVISFSQISLEDTLKKDIKMKNYFSYIDKLVEKYNDTLEYDISEYTLVHNNPWIIDTLAATDYYYQKSKGIIDLNQREKFILRKGTVLHIPTKSQNDAILFNLSQNYVEINIPEFTLNIYNSGLLIYQALIRVGRNESRYLKSIDRYTDLRTKTGSGKIYSTEKNPTWINPVDGHKYTETTRDDTVRTKMPITPSMMINLNKIISGQLIHSTTNPKTLGKAYSNGCMGTNEFDIWHIYYLAPINTPINIKYELHPYEGIELEDIYSKDKHKKRED